MFISILKDASLQELYLLLPGAVSSSQVTPCCQLYKQYLSHHLPKKHTEFPPGAKKLQSFAESVVMWVEKLQYTC